MAIAVGDGGLTYVSVGLRGIHGNLQKCIPGDSDILSRGTLLNRRMNVPDLPCGMMKSLAGKDNPIETAAACRLGLLHKHDVGCGMTLVGRIQGTRKGGGYRISIVIPEAAQGGCLVPLRRTTSESKENAGANYKRYEAWEG